MTAIQGLGKVTLPVFNGQFELGIAVGVDPALDDVSKLRVVAGVDRESAAMYSAAWAHQHDSTGERDLAAALGAAVVSAGWVSGEDGDIVPQVLPSKQSLTTIRSIRLLSRQQ